MNKKELNPKIWESTIFRVYRKTMRHWRRNMSKVVIIMADGYEELEAVSIIDILRRAHIDISIAGLSEKPVVSARGIQILPEKTIDEIDPDSYDMVVLPGGGGCANNLIADARVSAILQNMEKTDKYTAAICAAPYVLSEAGILKNKKATSYPSYQPKLVAKNVVAKDEVVIDDKVVTSQGPGTAIAFSLKLVELLEGAQVSQDIAKAMLVKQ